LSAEVARQATERAPRRVVWAVAAALACAAAVWSASTNSGKLIGPLDDEVLHVPIALRLVGDAAFAGDRWVETTTPVFSLPYAWLVGTLLRLLDDPAVVFRGLALPFHAAFLAGTWRVAERVGGRAAGAVAALICVLPPVAGLVLAPGAALPRDLVFALLPWLFLARDSVRTRGAGLALYAGLGVLANLHPLTAVHAAMWFLLLDLVDDPTGRGLRTAVLRGAAFAAGLAPYVIQYVTRPAVPGPVDEAVYVWRLGSMGGETLGEWARRMEIPLAVSVAAAVCAFAARGGTAWPRTLVVGAGAALVIGALGPTAGRFVAPLRAFQFGRFDRFALWCAAAGLAVGAVQLVRRRRFVALAAAAGVVALAHFGPALTGDNAGRGVFALVGRRLEPGGRSGPPPVPSGLSVRKDVVDPTLGEARERFLAVCRFAREQTPPDALYLVPPEQWAPFRVYARRSVAVTRKEGGPALSFLGARGMTWFEDYAEAVRVYAGGDAAAWAALAAKWGATHVVVDGSTPSPPPGPVVFEAGNFRVIAAAPR
jgi:hypothetical protein